MSAQAITAPRAIKAFDFKPCAKNTLLGWVNLQMPSGMRIRDCSIHKKGDSIWVGLPARKYTKDDGTEGWAALVEFADADSRRRFQYQAVAAVEDLGVL